MHRPGVNEGHPVQPRWWRRLIWSIGVGAVGLVMGLAFRVSQDHSRYGARLTEVLLATASLLGLSVLVSSSTLKRSRAWRYISIATAIIVIGALFKIQHWPGADMLVAIGSFAIMVSYGLHYARKIRKRWSDHLKLLWVLTWVSSSLIRFLHLVSWSGAMQFASFVLMWTALVVLAWENRTSNRTHGGGTVQR